ncbi:hypothetical protein BABINDRAFT_9227 [Babjeviella inositovora NRRL Y-12698]|uniref:CAP-Gly domain-containing protein n=1 Tax=Babjeviella inositovora NRRL Y-12698 TaxID=984486 RepID=A0A1E3QL78_9ASCO|nr:uncharacterized protein BABINDRAFT_9227 [Babjeviella inositovora NRRL Y-12698]ODQ78441.1 hypothetical protein BABINDRAFT_9227 [Babjeviella inositovora NRRL Y-12698]
MPSISLTGKELALDARVTLPQGGVGFLRYVGLIEGKEERGLFAGVELTGADVARGKNSGLADGVHYFQVAQAGSGIFLPYNRLATANLGVMSPSAHKPRTSSAMGRRRSMLPSPAGLNHGDEPGPSPGRSTPTHSSRDSVRFSSSSRLSLVRKPSLSSIPSEYTRASRRSSSSTSTLADKPRVVSAHSPYLAPMRKSSLQFSPEHTRGISVHSFNTTRSSSDSTYSLEERARIDALQSPVAVGRTCDKHDTDMQVRALAQAKDKLEGENALLSSRLEERSEILNELKALVSEYEPAIEALEHDLQQQAAQHTEVIHARDLKLEKVKNDNARVTQELREALAELEGDMGKNHELYLAEVDRLKDGIDARERLIAELLQEKARFEGKTEAIRQESAGELAALKSAIERMELAMVKIQEEMRGAKERYEAERKAITEERDMWRGKAEEVQAVAADKPSGVASETSLFETSHLTSKIDSLLAELDAKNAQIEILQRTDASEVAALQARLIDAEAELVEKTTAVVSLQLELESATEKFKGARELEGDDVNALERLRGELLAVTRRLEDADAERTARDTLVAELKEALEQSVRVSASERVNFENQLKIMSNSFDAKGNVMAVKDKFIADLQAKLAAAASEAAEEKRALKAKLAAGPEAMGEAAGEDRPKLEKEVQKLRRILENTASGLFNRDQHIDELKKQIDAKTREASVDKARLEKEVQLLHLKLQNVGRDLVSRNHTVEDVSSRAIRELEDEARKGENSRLEEDNAKLRAEIKILSIALEKAGRVLANKNGDIEVLRHQVGSLENLNMRPPSLVSRDSVSSVNSMNDIQMENKMKLLQKNLDKAHASLATKDMMIKDLNNEVGYLNKHMASGKSSSINPGAAEVRAQELAAVRAENAALAQMLERLQKGETRPEDARAALSPLQKSKLVADAQLHVRVEELNETISRLESQLLQALQENNHLNDRLVAISSDSPGSTHDVDDSAVSEISELMVYKPERSDVSAGRKMWCGLCEREGHDSMECPYENDMF